MQFASLSLLLILSQATVSDVAWSDPVLICKDAVYCHAYGVYGDPVSKDLHIAVVLQTVEGEQIGDIIVHPNNEFSNLHRWDINKEFAAPVHISGGDDGKYIYSAYTSYKYTSGNNKTNAEAGDGPHMYEQPYFVESYDNGQTWSSPIECAMGRGANDGNSKIVTTSLYIKETKKIFVFYLSEVDNAITFNSRLPNQKSFTSEKKIVSYPVGDWIYWMRSAYTFSNNKTTLHLAFALQKQKMIYYTNSADTITWKQPVPIDSFDGTKPLFDLFSTETSTLHLVYSHDLGSYAIKSSSNNGGSWSARKNAFHGDYIYKGTSRDDKLFEFSNYHKSLHLYVIDEKTLKVAEKSGPFPQDQKDNTPLISAFKERDGKYNVIAVSVRYLMPPSENGLDHYRTYFSRALIESSEYVEANDK